MIARPTLAMLDALLDLGPLRPGGENVSLEFARPFPAWVWLLAAALCVGAAMWTYRGVIGQRAARVALSLLRAALLIVVLVLLSGPQLTRPDRSVVADWIVVLVDRSASMTIADARGDDGAPATRDRQLRAALAQLAPSLAADAQDRRVLWLGFDGAAYELPQNDDQAPPQIPDAAARRTNLGRAIDDALQRLQGQPVAAVVLLTDGRSADQPDAETLRRLGAARTPVYAVALGSDEPIADLAVARVEAPRAAYAGDPIPVRVELESRAGAPGPVTVQLVDTDTGMLLDESEFVWDDAEGGNNEIVLFAEVNRPGARRLGVRLDVEPGADLIADNNSAEVSLRVVDEPLRVLYVDGYPRWEYRFLKNLLIRERTVRSTIMLLAGGRRYIQEGDVLLGAAPATAEEWREFDVVILGDVRPEMFTTEQLAQVRDHVAVNGAGVLWISGEGATPEAWADTPLDALLPFDSQRGAGRRLPVWPEAVTMAPAPAAQRLGVLMLDSPNASASPAASWPAALSDPMAGWSRLRWAHRLEPALLKPAVETLAVARAESDAQQTAPLVVTMRFGAGRVVSVGSDETWRWRYGRGEQYFERFWIQLVRLLGRATLERTGQPALLDITPSQARVNQPTRITLELIDQRLIDTSPETHAVHIIRVGPPGAPPLTPGPDARIVAELTLRADEADASSRFGLAATRRFAADWLPTSPGAYIARLVEPLSATGDDPAPARADIWLPDDELLTPATDHALLRDLADRSGGAVVTAEELPEALANAPRRAVVVSAAPIVDPLWDTPAALIAVLSLLTAEWIGRRLLRLA